tara:strand:+ start:703 stop:975 length:273 start_codon:yes stop_codon:yes gene_type:complete
MHYKEVTMSIAFKAGLLISSIGRHTAKATAGVTTEFARGMAAGAKTPEVLPAEDDVNIDEQLKTAIHEDVQAEQLELPGMNVPQPEKANG